MRRGPWRGARSRPVATLPAENVSPRARKWHVPAVPRARVWWIVSLALACAGPPPPLPAGVKPRPVPGDSLETLLAKLPHAEHAGEVVEVTELRLLAVDREPWTALDPARAASASGRVGVVAGRRCTFWEGVRRTRVERASWFLLRDGALEAFDHDSFEARCVPRPVYEPTRGEDVPVEHMLVRYVSQRWPVDVVPPEARLVRGMRLLALGRTGDAEAELRALDLQIGELERRQNDAETADPAERERLREQEEELRPLRAQLRRAIREQEDPQKGDL